MPVSDAIWATQDLAKRIPAYKLYTDYYFGRHRLMYASESFNEFFRAAMEGLRENLCPAVVNAPAELLTISGWDGEGGSGQAAQNLYEARYGAHRANSLHRESFRSGDSYALVWPDTTRELWPHRGDQMTVKYNPDTFDTLLFGAKCWVDAEGYGRVNVYYADVLERWRTVAKAATGATVWPDKPESWVEHTDDDGPAVIRHTFGEVPVAHFPNGADLGDFGRSELHDVIPLQDALNKSLADLMITMESFAIPLRVFLNYTPDRDPITGQEKAMDFDPRRDFVLGIPGDKTSVTQFPQADLDKLTGVQEQYAAKIARVKGIPGYYFMQQSGDFPSGEALRTASGRLIAKGTDAQQSWTPPWVKTMTLMGVPNARPIWAPAAPLSDEERLATVQGLVDAGVPLRAALLEYGWDSDKIDEVLAQGAADTANAGQLAVDAFRRGQPASELLT